MPLTMLPTVALLLLFQLSPALAGNGDNNARERTIASDIPSVGNWALVITARIASISDSSAMLGVRPDATPDFDSKYDEPRPPDPPGNNVQAYFPHTGGNWPTMLGTKFAVDITSPTSPSWKMEVQSTIISSSLTLQWDTSVINGLPKDYHLYLCDTSASDTINMRTNNHYSFLYSSPRTFLIWAAYEATILTLRSKWNLVSIPRTCIDTCRSTLFPTAISRAFTYNGRYIATDTLSTGRGYWIKFDSAQAVVISGKSMSSLNIKVSQGWNLIGTVNHEVAAPTGGLIISNFFSYDGRYTSSTTLQPGKGYWIKSSADGIIMLGTSSEQIVEPKEPGMDQNMSLIVSTDVGESQTLYLLHSQANDEVNPSQYELPPPPPDGLFDVRFASQQYVEYYSGPEEKGKSFTVQVQSLQPTLRVRASLSIPNMELIVEYDGPDGSRCSARLVDGMSTKIPRPTSGSFIVTVRLIGRRPAAFQLSQNYPNPFNPTTTIQYVLPEAARVRLYLTDVCGRSIRMLEDASRSAGSYSVQMDAQSLGLASGVYLYRLEGVGMNSGTIYRESKKLLLIK